MTMNAAQRLQHEAATDLLRRMPGIEAWLAREIRTAEATGQPALAAAWRDQWRKFQRLAQQARAIVD